MYGANWSGSTSEAEVTAALGEGGATQAQHAPSLASPVPIGIGLVLLAIGAWITTVAFATPVVLLSQMPSTPATVDARGRIVLTGMPTDTPAMIVVITDRDLFHGDNKVGGFDIRTTAGRQWDAANPELIGGPHCGWMDDRATDMSSNVYWKWCAADLPADFELVPLEKVGSDPYRQPWTSNANQDPLPESEALAALREPKVMTFTESSMAVGPARGSLAQGFGLGGLGLALIGFGVVRRARSVREMARRTAMLEARASGGGRPLPGLDPKDLG